MLGIFFGSGIMASAAVQNEVGFFDSDEELLRYQAWTYVALDSGDWPMLDWNRKAFTRGTIDFDNKGKPLVGGYFGHV